MAGLSLSRVLGDFPDIEVKKVELFTNRKRALQDGVRSVPALVFGDKQLSGLLLTGKSIRRFLESL